MHPRFSFIFLACALSFAKERPEVTGTMRNVFTALMNLQPFLASSERFKSKDHRKEIASDLKTMANIKHAFPKKMTDEEPGVAGITDLFLEHLKDAEQRFKEGNYEYARHKMRTITNLCFSCHTRVSSTKGFEDFQKRIEAAKYTDYEKAEIYAATRQWEKALSTYERVLGSVPKDELGVIQYTRGLRHALSVAVRVKKSPQEALKILDTVNKRKDLPEFVKRFVSHWQKDAKYWESNAEAKDLAGEKKVELARELVDRAMKLQSFPADENGDISYLRASTLLHEALDSTPKAKYRGEALYLLGVCYYALQDPTLWDLDKMYFESCIRETPHSDLAKKCFQRYSEKIYLGYSGSAGTFIPESEAKKMTELRKLSE